jgi:hypothetical protein
MGTHRPACLGDSQRGFHFGRRPAGEHFGGFHAAPASLARKQVSYPPATG